MSGPLDWLMAAVLGLLAGLLVAVIVVALAGGFGEADPCVIHHAKTSDEYLHGWQRYGGRDVWCGPGRHP